MFGIVCAQILSRFPAFYFSLIFSMKTGTVSHSPSFLFLSFSRLFIHSLSRSLCCSTPSRLYFFQATVPTKSSSPLFCEILSGSLEKLSQLRAITSKQGSEVGTFSPRKKQPPRRRNTSLCTLFMRDVR